MAGQTEYEIDDIYGQLHFASPRVDPKLIHRSQRVREVTAGKERSKAEQQVSVAT
jgi:hypothetical protein